jgi:hypothetical protein
MADHDPHPDACLTEQEFEALSRGVLAPAALQRLRDQVQATLDDPRASVSHDEVWSRLEQRMKRAARAA